MQHLTSHSDLSLAAVCHAPTLSARQGPQGLSLLDVCGPDSPWLERTLELFSPLFGPYLRYLPYIRACALRHSPDHPHAVGHVWLVLDPRRAAEPALEQAVGFQIFNYVPPRRGGFGFGMGAFRGLLEPYQHGGVGAWLLRCALEQIAQDARERGEAPPRGHVVEVKLPDDPEARARFAAKTGAQVLEVDYQEPPMLGGVSYHTPQSLAGVEPTPMGLVFYPDPQQGPLTASELPVLLEGLYLDYYRLGPDSALLEHALNSLEPAR